MLLLPVYDIFVSMKHLNIFVYKKYQSSKLNIPNEYLYDNVY